MFQSICDLIPADPDMPERARRLDIMRRVLNGTLYDVLPHDFHEERTPGGEYIPLRLRRPSVRYALSRIVTEDSVALLFSEGHFPTIDSPDRSTRDTLAALLKSARFNEVMIDAALRGAIGSVAIMMRILAGRPFFTTMETVNLTPIWRPDAPDTLAAVIERYKLPGANFAAAGYSLPDLGASYWFNRRWDATAETWYLPQLVGDPSPPTPDLSRSGQSWPRLRSDCLDPQSAGRFLDRGRRRWSLHLSRRNRDRDRDRLSALASRARAEIQLRPNAADQGAGRDRR